MLQAGSQGGLLAGPLFLLLLREPRETRGVVVDRRQACL